MGLEIKGAGKINNFFLNGAGNLQKIIKLKLILLIIGSKSVAFYAKYKQNKYK